jgi:hypothetical protein
VQEATGLSMERSIVMPLGVVVERRELDNPWQKWSWQPVAVIPGAPPTGQWRELARGEGWIRWHAATLQLELHHKETEAYRYNLSTRQPAIYVVLRKDEGAVPEQQVRPFVVTASPYEAQEYLESGEDTVEPVAMTPALMAWVQAFVERHPAPEPFKKRKRKRYDPEEAGLGRRPERFGGPPGRNRGRHGRA